MSAGDELWQAELDFVRRTAELGAEGWASSFAEDGVQLRPGVPPVVGRAAIRELMEPALAQEGLEFTWEPLRAEVAEANDMGFTYGTWRIAVHGGSARRGSTSRCGGATRTAPGASSSTPATGTSRARTRATLAQVGHSFTDPGDATRRHELPRSES